MLKTIENDGRRLGSTAVGALLLASFACGGVDDSTILLDAEVPEVAGEVGADERTVQRDLASIELTDADYGEAPLDVDAVVAKAPIVRFLRPTVNGRKIFHDFVSDIMYCNAKGFRGAVIPTDLETISGSILTAEWSLDVDRWIFRSDLTPPITDQRVYAAIRCSS